MENLDVVQQAAETANSNGGFLATAGETASGLFSSVKDWATENPVLATVAAVATVAGIGYIVYKKWFADEK